MREFQNLLIGTNFIKIFNMRKINVAIIQTGVPKYRHEFYEEIQRLDDLDIDIISVNREIGTLTDISEPKYKLFYTGRIIKLPLGLYFQTNVAFRKYKYDAVVINSNLKNIALWILLIRSIFNSWHLMLWGHLATAKVIDKKVFFRLWVSGIASAHIFYTKKESDTYISMFKNSKAYFLGNGLDITSIQNNTKKFCAVEKQNRILFIGRLEKKANLEILIKAIDLMNSGDYYLSIIGDGSQLDNLKKLVFSLNLQTRITFHGGITDHAHIGTIAQKCKIFCYPGDIGLSLIHGMGLSLPIVIHDTFDSHMPEVEAFDTNYSGMVFVKNSAESLCEVLQNLLFQNETMDEMSKYNAIKVKNKYNTKKMAFNFINAIKEVSENDRYR
jgi:glycosyltransferase involved in cell wall biosynthesis